MIVRITNTYILSALATVCTVAGVLLAIIHKAPFDTFLLLGEWILFVGLVVVGYRLLLRRSAPLCHVIYVRVKGDHFFARTEYYRVSHHGGRALAAAIAKAQRDPYVISVTYHEQGQEETHIPIHAVDITKFAPPYPDRPCERCGDTSWEWTGKQYQCLTCQIADEAVQALKTPQ